MVLPTRCYFIARIKHTVFLIPTLNTFAIYATSLFLSVTSSLSILLYYEIVKMTYFMPYGIRYAITFICIMFLTITMTKMVAGPPI